MSDLLILAAILLLTSCGTKKYLTSSTPSNDIENLNYFAPISYIQYIEKENKATFSDSLSKISSHKIDSILNENKSTFRLSEGIIFENNTLKEKIEDEVAFLINHITRQKSLNGISIPPALASVLHNHQQRFALATVATGFGRRKRNYGGQVAKGAAVGILTLGMVIPTPIKSNLTLFAIIFDIQKNEIAYFKKAPPIELDPTSEMAIKKQLHELFEGYLY